MSRESTPTDGRRSAAEAAERNLAEQVWRLKKQQETSKQLTAEEKELDDQAIAAHESFKRKFEERQDELIRDSPAKRQRHHREPPMMSGALGQLPQATHSNKGANLIPESPAENTPPPWSDEGPPAVKLRLTVTSGYYVRSFCHDLGTTLGSAGIMAELCRTRQSDFTVGGINCLEYEDLEKGEEVWAPQVADMLARWNAEPEGQWQTSPSKPDDPPSRRSERQTNNAKANHVGSPTSKPETRPRPPSTGGILSPPKAKSRDGSPKAPPGQRSRQESRGFRRREVVERHRGLKAACEMTFCFRIRLADGVLGVLCLWRRYASDLIRDCAPQSPL